MCVCCCFFCFFSGDVVVLFLFLLLFFLFFGTDLDDAVYMSSVNELIGTGFASR